ncbi:MAG: tripartite tricarboxylate transporter substrate binding protein [Proteobacteria bacterium]|nr:tripartite tricarboxylate transporter substrate binding protein [Pseudomonadota bacterium]
MSTLRVLFSAAALIATLIVGAADASAWEPKQPISIVVGFSPGGGTDIIARHIASTAQPTIPVPIVVLNKAGASGAIAAETVKNAKPDGYTMFVAGGSESVSIGNHRKLPYDVRKDFTGILQITRQRVFLTVKADARWKTLADMVAEAKANPGKLSFASAGAGSSYHSIMLVLQKLAAVEMKHLPYQGGAPAVAALLGGHVDVSPHNPEETQAMYDAGRVRYLAVASDTRSPILPDVPTLREAGYDIYIENIKGLAGPAGMPQDVVAYLHDKFKAAMESDTFKRLAAQANLELQYRGGKDYMDAMVAMFNQIGKVVSPQ